MSIKATDAIRVARSLIGMPYAELDCINLIKKVIRTAPGGVKSYTTAGTNTLWRSFENANKYRDIEWRIASILHPEAGLLAFKADGTDFHHVGIVTDNGTVIHSSSTQGGRGVVETPLTAREGWTHLARHRYIQTAAIAAETEESMAALHKARVVTNGGKLNIRQVPEVGKVIGEIPFGEVVNVYSTGEWPRVGYGDMLGYASAKYLERIAEEQEMPEENVLTIAGTPVIVDGAGNEFFPQGGWHVEFRTND